MFWVNELVISGRFEVVIVIVPEFSEHSMDTNMSADGLAAFRLFHSFFAHVYCYCFDYCHWVFTHLPDEYCA